MDMRHMAVQSANSWHYSGNRSKKGGLVMRQEMNGAAHGRAQGMAGNFRDSVLVFKNVRAIVIDAVGTAYYPGDGAWNLSDPDSEI